MSIALFGHLRPCRFPPQQQTVVANVYVLQPTEATQAHENLIRKFARREMHTKRK